MFGFGKEKELEETEIEESTYSVLIHFTAKREYVYQVENGHIYSGSNGTVTLEDSEGKEYEVSGGCVFVNDLESKDKAEEFIYSYKLENPIIFTY